MNNVRQSVDRLERKVQELTRAEAELQRYNVELLQAKNTLEAQVAELARKSEQLETARNGAEAANQAKSKFLATMSHELRTPLNGVLGMTHLLLNTELNSQQRRYGRAAQASAEALLRLINDILDFSKIEAGKLELETIDFDLRYATENVVELMAHEARLKRLELVFSLAPEVPVRLRGDPGRLRQVLTNLMSNAVKFTQAGEVVVRATVEAETEGRATLRFTVTDTGIGIAPDRVGRLFQSFSQVDSSTTRKYGGTGLGLAISKHLCEMMGGQIGVDTTADKGSTFWCTMDLEKQPPGAHEPRPLATQFRGVPILAVDHSATCREIVEQQLRVWGFQCQTAPDGERALALLQTAAANGNPFRLAILDLHMPGMDGELLARAIKATPALQETTLVSLTYLADQVDAPRLQAAGFAERLTKPILQSQLYDAIQRVLVEPTGTQDRHPRHPERQQGAHVSPANAALRKRARILLAEDHEINQELVAEILRNEGLQCDIVPDGQLAVKAVLRQAYDLVLMDCNMPEMDGFEATRQIRRQEKAGLVVGHRAGQLPIIALTANAMTGDREACLAAGMTDYLSKPFLPEQVLRTIDSYLLAAASAHEAPDGNAPVTTAESSCPFDFETLLQRCMGNREFLQKMIRKFQKRLGSDVEQLERSVALGNGQEIERQAHSLKGAAANLSAEALRVAAARLETMGRAGDLTAAPLALAELQHESRRFLAYRPEAYTIWEPVQVGRPWDEGSAPKETVGNDSVCS